MAKANTKINSRRMREWQADLQQRVMLRDQVNDRSRKLLLSAIARRYGTDDGNGGKRLELSQAELGETPPHEKLTVEPRPGAEPGKTDGIVVRVHIETPPAPEPATDAATLPKDE